MAVGYCSFCADADAGARDRDADPGLDRRRGADYCAGAAAVVAIAPPNMRAQIVRSTTSPLNVVGFVGRPRSRWSPTTTSRDESQLRYSLATVATVVAIGGTLLLFYNLPHFRRGGEAKTMVRLDPRRRCWPRCWRRAAPARAACIVQAGGDLGEIERLWFSTPRARGAARGELLVRGGPADPVWRDAEVILAEAQRQAGRYAEANAAATVALAALGDSGLADLQLQLGIAQALAWHADHCRPRAASLSSSTRRSPPSRPARSGEACIRTGDRGWLRFSDGDTEGALRDLIPAYEQLQAAPHARGPGDRRRPARHRYVGAREFEQATDLIDDHRPLHRDARPRALPTAYDRLGRHTRHRAAGPTRLDAFGEDAR